MGMKIVETLSKDKRISILSNYSCMWFAKQRNIWSRTNGVPSNFSYMI